MADEDVEFAVKTVNQSTAALDEINGGYDALIANTGRSGGAAREAAPHFETLADGTQRVTEGARSGAGSLEQLHQTLSVVNNVMEIGNQVLRYAEQAYAATTGKSQEYNRSILELMAITGQSAESTSRMIQVLDDWGVSADQVGAATRKLTAQGLTPNLETIAKLSDQYLEINDVQQRNKFVTDNLGVSGRAWNQVLAQGSKALLDQAAAVDKNLVATDKHLDQSERLRLAQDRLKDATDGLAVATGNVLTPAIAATAETWAISVQAMQESLATHVPYTKVVERLREELNAEQEAQLKRSEATRLAAAADEIAAEAAKNNADAMRDASQANSEYLSMLGSFTSSLDTFKDKQADLAASREEFNQKLSDAKPWEVDKILEYKEKLNEIAGAEQELASQRALEKEAFIQQQLEKALAADGLLSKLDQQLLIDRGVEKGLISEEAKTELDAALKEVEDAVRQQKDAEKAILDERTENYNKHKDATKGMIDEEIGTLQQWIDRLGEVPAEVTTRVTAEYTKTTAGEIAGESASLGSRSGGNIIYNIANAYFGEGHEIYQSPSLVGGG